MAQNIWDYMRRHPDQEIFTYSGNYHSRLDEKNMGAEILRLAKGELDSGNSDNLLIWPGGGAAWNCILDANKKMDCGVHNSEPSHDIYSTATDAFLYYLPEEIPHFGHHKTLYVRSVSASLPLNYFSLPCKLTETRWDEFVAMEHLPAKNVTIQFILNIVDRSSLLAKRLG